MYCATTIYSLRHNYSNSTADAYEDASSTCEEQVFRILLRTARSSLTLAPASCISSSFLFVDEQGISKRNDIRTSLTENLTKSVIRHELFERKIELQHKIWNLRPTYCQYHVICDHGQGEREPRTDSAMVTQMLRQCATDRRIEQTPTVGDRKKPHLIEYLYKPRSV